MASTSFASTVLRAEMRARELREARSQKQIRGWEGRNRTDLTAWFDISAGWTWVDTGLAR